MRFHLLDRVSRDGFKIDAIRHTISRLLFHCRRVKFWIAIEPQISCAPDHAEHARVLHQSFVLNQRIEHNGFRTTRRLEPAPQATTPDSIATAKARWSAAPNNAGSPRQHVERVFRDLLWIIGKRVGDDALDLDQARIAVTRFFRDAPAIDQARQNGRAPAGGALCLRRPCRRQARGRHTTFASCSFAGDRSRNWGQAPDECRQFEQQRQL